MLEVEREHVGTDKSFFIALLDVEGARHIALVLRNVESVVARKTKNAIDRLGDTALTLNHKELEDFKAGSEVDTHFVGVFITFK